MDGKPGVVERRGQPRVERFERVTAVAREECAAIIADEHPGGIVRVNGDHMPVHVNTGGHFSERLPAIP